MSNTLISADDAFLGTWVLLPEQAKYEIGQPPESGLYRLSSNGEQYHFSVEWVDASGESHSTAFDGIPDGQQYAYTDNPAVDAVSFTRVDEQTLESASFKAGELVSHARRVLSADGNSMTVSQTGVAPDGRAFTNMSVYVKQA